MVSCIRILKETRKVVKEVKHKNEFDYKDSERYLEEFGNEEVEEDNTDEEDMDVKKDVLSVFDEFQIKNDLDIDPPVGSVQQ